MTDPTEALIEKMALGMLGVSEWVHPQHKAYWVERARLALKAIFAAGYSPQPIEPTVAGVYANQERMGAGMMEKHFVIFMSPGTFVPEATEREIASWDVDTAAKMALNIVERYGARPFGFQFVTLSRGENDLNSKETARSGTYYLGGRIETLAEVEARNDPKEEILRFNMRANEIDRIIINDNSWRFVTELEPDDIVLDVKLPPRKDPTSND